jgi:hypothetical protein
MSAARLARVELPDLGPPGALPPLAPAIHEHRLERLRERARRAGYDVLVVWADREHSANLAWLSGFDPRFEEALLDIIPATGGPYFTTNIEDGIALADGALRDEFAARYPGAWQRIQARRAFMTEVLGLTLHDDVLPLTNLAAYLPPFLLAADQAMTLRH